MDSFKHAFPITFVPYNKKIHLKRDAGSDADYQAALRIVEFVTLSLKVDSGNALKNSCVL